MFRRPAWDPLPPPPGQDPATARDFQSLAAASYAGFDAAVNSTGHRLAQAAGVLGPSQAAIADAGAGLASFAAVATATGSILDGLDPGRYDTAVDAALSAIEQYPTLGDIVGDSMPDASCLIPGFPAVPSFSISQPPAPAAPPVEGPGQAAQVLWHIGLGAQVLSVPLGTTAALAFPGVAPGAITSGLPVLAGILPIISGLALGAALPLLILDILGVSFTYVPSAADIALLERQVQPLIDQPIRYIEGIAWAFKPPYDKPYKPGFVEYDYIYGLLRNAVCLLFGVRDHWNYQWVADNLTKLAQAWTKATGRFPPDVSCANWPHPG